MFFLAHLFHVLLRAPLPTTPVTFILVHLFTQSFSSCRSTCPNHLNRALWISSSTHSMPKQLNNSSLCFYHLTTLHMHILRTIILSALLNLFRSSAFIAHIWIPYTNTLWTQASYIFPFKFEETPLLVKTGASSLNFPQAALWKNVIELFHILCDAKKVRIPRWRLTNWKYLYSSQYTTCQLQNSNVNSHIFKVD